MDKEPRVCLCDCGETFIPNRSWQKYVNIDHKRRKYLKDRPLIYMTPERRQRIRDRLMEAMGIVLDDELTQGQERE